jgi:hypothetical protein
MRVLAIVFVCLFSACVARAQLVSTIGQTPDGYLPLQRFDWWGFSFSTNGSNYSLNSVTASLNVVDSGPFTVSLYTASGGLPTSGILASTSLTILSGPTTFANYTFSFDTPQFLAANTSYALVFQPGSGSFNIETTGEFTGFTGPGSMPTGLIYSGTEGNSWSPEYVGEVRAVASVNASVVPEPSVALLVPFGLACVLMMARRRSLTRR